MKTQELIVEELDTMLKLSGKPVMTMTWSEFYKLSGRNRIKSSFQDKVKKFSVWPISTEYSIWCQCSNCLS